MLIIHIVASVILCGRVLLTQVATTTTKCKDQHLQTSALLFLIVDMHSYVHIDTHICAHEYM